MNEYKLLKLKNGLRLVLVPKSSTEVVTVMIMFKVGSRNENDEVAGISHLLEHMHYKGTKKRKTALEISEFIESTGGQHNAFTGKEYTGYYVKLAPKHLEKAFDFLSDNVTNSIFNAKELEKEKNVIIEEINMYEDLPMMIAPERFEEAIMGDNSLGRDIIGTKKSVKGVSQSVLKDYKSKYYNSDNAVFVLAGNFGKYNQKELVSLAEKYFKLPSGKMEKEEPIEINNKKALKLVDRKTEQSHIVVGFKTVPLEHPDYFKLELLSIILGGSMSSRMFEEVREKRGLAYSVKTLTSNYVEAGCLFTQAGVPHEKTYEAIKAILNEYKKIKKEVVEKTELDKAKEILTGKTLIKFEDSEEVAFHFASEALLCKEILTPKDMLKKLQKITPLDIIKTAQKYLIDNRLGLAFIGKGIDKEKIEKIFKM